MAWVFENVNAYVNRLVREQLASRFVSARPLLYFMAAQAQNNLDLLLTAQKNPNDNWSAGVSMGGSGIGLAKRMMLNGSVGHEFRYQKTRPTGATNVQPGGVTPTASVFSEDLAGTAETRWTTTMTPLKIRESTIENTKGKTAIGSVVEEAVAMSFNEAFAQRQDQFWNGTLTSTQQDNSEWYDGLIGVRHWVDDGVITSGFATVGRVDRTVQTVLKANAYTATTLKNGGVIPSTVPTLEMIRRLRTQDAYGGIANRNPDAGDLCITTPDLWNVLASEAEGQHTIYDDGSAGLTNVPSILKTVGLKYPVIKKDTTYITYDPSCASGELLLLTTGSFMYEIQGGNNYRLGNWVSKHETEEGGGRYRWTNITVKDRLTCVNPWDNTKITGLTTT